MAKDIVVYTAVTGARDLPRDPVYCPPHYHFVCFTDRSYQLKSWTQIIIRGNDEPRRIARKYKILSHDLFPEFEFSVWHDASMTLIGDLAPLIEHLGDRHFGAFSHRWRACLYEEAHHCIATRKDKRSIIERQIKRYREAGFPDGAGLWETGVLVRRNSEVVEHVNGLWWDEVSAYSARDQLSFSYSLWRAGCACATFDGNVEANQCFDFDICNHNRSMRDILTQEASGVPVARICEFYGIDEEALLRWKMKCTKTLKGG